MEIVISILQFLIKKNFKWLDPAKRFLTAIIRLLSGDTGKIIDQCHNFANEVVKKVELIDIETKLLAKRKVEIDCDFVISESNKEYPDFLLNENQVDEIKNLYDLNFIIENSNDLTDIGIAVTKRMAVKYDLAFELCINYAKDNKKDITAQALNYMIEFAVNSFFTKSIK